MTIADNIKLIPTDLEEGEYALDSEVAFMLAPDGSGRLFDMDDFFYAISPVGARMLQLALSRDGETAIDTLAQSYKADKDTIRHDYVALLRDLEGRRLIARRSALRKSGVPETRGLASVLRPLLRLIRRLPLKPRAWILMMLAHGMLGRWGWNRTVRAWLQAHQALEPHPENGADTIHHAFRVVAARHPLPINCKERSLSAWSLCTMEGISASITVGVSLFPLASHCWCGTATECVSDFDDRVETFTPLLIYPEAPQCGGDS
jgi:hypothetical protein